jgi:GT2 family glycosyltransferase
MASGRVRELADDVTVVIPAWGSYAGELLDSAVASVASQQPVPRILVIDNASTRPIPLSTDAHVLRCADRRTIGSARNFGLNAVDTEFVVFWDADDVMVPGAIGHMRRALRADDEVALVATRILESQGTYHHWPRMALQRLARWRSMYALVHAVSSLYPTTGSVMMRTEVLRSAGGFPDTDESDDWVAGASMALRGRVRVLDVPGRVYRLHASSLSASWTPRHRIRAARFVRQRLHSDPALRRSFRVLTPFLAPAQWFVLLVLRPVRLGCSRRHLPSTREQASSAMS